MAPVTPAKAAHARLAADEAVSRVTRASTASITMPDIAESARTCSGLLRRVCASPNKISAAPDQSRHEGQNDTWGRHGLQSLSRVGESGSRGV